MRRDERALLVVPKHPDGRLHIASLRVEKAILIGDQSQVRNGQRICGPLERESRDAKISRLVNLVVDDVGTPDVVEPTRERVVAVAIQYGGLGREICRQDSARL